MKLTNLVRIGVFMEISLYEAKTNFSKIVQLLIDEKEEKIIITKNGKPVVTISPFQKKNQKRIGLLKKAKGDFDISLEEFNNIEISDFDGDSL